MLLDENNMIIAILGMFFLSSMVLFSILGVYLHLTTHYSHPEALKEVKPTAMECKVMSDKTDENIWTLVEGLASIEEYKEVEAHLAICIPCAEHYGNRVQALRITNPVRYNTLYSEMINVKKAKLLRKARNVGVEVNLAPVKNLFDLYRIALLVNLSPKEQHLISEWDNASENEKSKLIITLSQRFNLF